jgi:hypothetical protein
MRGADDRITEIRTAAPPGRRLGALLIGCLCAALLGSEPLLAWSRNLPDGEIARAVQPAAEAWQGAMEAIGFTRPYRALRAAIRFAESA